MRTARRTITRLREEPTGSIAVEVDGELWRSLPPDAVVRAGLREGVDLDRERLRALRRELRRGAALAVAAKSLRVRDLTRGDLEERLEQRGVPADERADALETLVRAGIVDDERFAFRRAATLAARCRGDGAIRWELERHGVSPDLVERAIAELEPERERARRVVREKGPSPATVRLLAARGFDEGAIESAAGQLPERADER